MELKIKRTHSTRLYTEGLLYINDMRTTSTVEDTLTMLPAGLYRIRLTKGKKRRRVIGIIPNPPHKGGVGGGLYHFEACGSHISSRKNNSICIGQPIIPGALAKGRDIYDRLFDRIEKAEARKEPIYLIITDDNMTTGDPIQYWLEPSDHNCPATKRRVELNEEDNSVDIYEGNIHIRHLTVEEQKALREA